MGIEPTNKGFADPPLSHLGTAPRLLANYTLLEGLDAPVGVEPTNRGFADPSLDRLGTARRLLPNYTPNRG